MSLRVPAALLAIAASIVLPQTGARAHGPGVCAVRHYSPVTLPLNPAAINVHGEVVGTTAGRRAALWSARGGLREVPLPDGYPHSEGLSLDARGFLIGIAHDPPFTVQRGFLFANGSFTWLEGRESRGYRINDAGTVVGESIPPGAQCSGPALWVRHETRALDGCRGTARSLNGRGQVVGDTYDDEGRYHAFLWTARDGMTRIGPSEPFSSAIAINDRGHVVIQGFPAVFLYADGASTRLPLSPKYPSQPHAMNDCDVVVGSFGPFSDANRAFVWEKSTGFRDLNGLLTHAAGWKLQSAVDINDRGEIVGKGRVGRAENVGFLLLPVD